MEVFLFILGYYVHFIASCVLLYKIGYHKSIYGLSTDTQISYLLAVICRCIWVMETRLIETTFAYIELMLSTCAAVALVYSCYKHRLTGGQNMQIHHLLRVYCTAPAALLLAFFFHPGDDWWSMQILVSFTMYMEAMGLLPQLWLMRKMHEVEALTSHYVGLLVVARIVRMIFWGKLFVMGEHFAQLLIADVLHTLLSADYLYLWCRKLRHGGRLIYSQGVSV